MAQLKCLITDGWSKSWFIIASIRSEETGKTSEPGSLGGDDVILNSLFISIRLQIVIILDLVLHKQLEPLLSTIFCLPSLHEYFLEL